MILGQKIRKELAEGKIKRMAGGEREDATGTKGTNIRSKATISLLVRAVSARAKKLGRKGNERRSS